MEAWCGWLCTRTQLSFQRRMRLVIRQDRLGGIGDETICPPVDVYMDVYLDNQVNVHAMHAGSTFVMSAIATTLRSTGV